MYQGLRKCAALTFAAALLLSLSACQQQGTSQERVTMNPGGQNPKTLLAEYYESVEAEVEARAPAYDLPLGRDAICNQEDVFLQPAGWELLERNGFCVVPHGRAEDIVEIYEQFRDRDIPVFVTADTLLHLYHIQFDETLKAIEERDFHPRIVGFSEKMLELSEADHKRFDGELKEAARRNVAYFSVGLSTLTGQTKGPSTVKDEVDAELALIEAHGGFSPSPIFVYEEDYSQYVPRGHYTRSELLKRYFKGLMWYGRISMLLKGESDDTTGLIPDADARIQTLQASLIAQHIHGDDPSLPEDWNRIYGVTAFYVGLADDLTPFEYAEAIQKVSGASLEWAKLATPETIHALRSELATYRSPEIYGGTGNVMLMPPFSPEQLDEVLEDTKGMRLMGQRFIPDSYMFQQLVIPAAGDYTGNAEPFTLVRTPGGPQRGFPRGLDVMAVMGSGRALGILQAEGDTEYEHYDEQLAKLRQMFAGFSETEWNRNLYWSWLYALQALIEPRGEGYPTFMQTEAWQDRSLWAALASWAELRHDTILYAKQSYAMVAGAAPPGPEPPPPPPSYVEPVPEFYARLLALTRMTLKGLTELDVLDEQSQGRLQELESIIERMMRISVQELRNEKLSEDDYHFIDYIADALERTVVDVEETGIKTSIIADVHTDGNTRHCLEEGVGYVHLIYACYPVPDGRIAVGVGPVLSYYEFKHPMADRLTDEAWRQMLAGEVAPEPPAWASSFLAPET